MALGVGLCAGLLLSSVCRPALPEPEHAARPAPPRWVADRTVEDLARAIPDSALVRVNLPAMAVLPPPLASFFFLHEQAHLVLRHDVRATPAARRRMELEADCWATRRATREQTAAAVAFFARLGAFTDALHPAGAERAAEILRCDP